MSASPKALLPVSVARAGLRELVILRTALAVEVACGRVRCQLNAERGARPASMTSA